MVESVVHLFVGPKLRMEAQTSADLIRTIQDDTEKIILRIQPAKDASPAPCTTLEATSYARLEAGNLKHQYDRIPKVHLRFGVASASVIFGLSERNGESEHKVQGVPIGGSSDRSGVVDSGCSKICWSQSSLKNILRQTSSDTSSIPLTTDSSSEDSSLSTYSIFVDAHWAPHGKLVPRQQKEKNIIALQNSFGIRNKCDVENICALSEQNCLEAKGYKQKKAFDFEGFILLLLLGLEAV
ncbi:hypothetical protein Tco_1081834 [Tanacetum coccineum]|uniref:Uncharacterized protein n=1 Tax=Tanacetum coccineum TaxID=301880 RepID=A0ABQ5HZK8_9ASTR